MVIVSLMSAYRGVHPILKQFSRDLLGAFYVGNGWVVGGCWDYMGLLLIVSQWIIPENSLLSTKHQ